jgi:hypothetical protein
VAGLLEHLRRPLLPGRAACRQQQQSKGENRAASCQVSISLVLDATATLFSHGFQSNDALAKRALRVPPSVSSSARNATPSARMSTYNEYFGKGGRKVVADFQTRLPAAFSHIFQLVSSTNLRCGTNNAPSTGRMA